MEYSSYTPLDLPRLALEIKERGWELAEAVLHRHGIQWEERAGEAICCVPWRDDKTPSLHILMAPRGSKRAGMFVDSARKEGGGNALELLARFEGIHDLHGANYSKAIRLAADLLGINTDNYAIGPKGTDPSAMSSPSDPITDPTIASGDGIPYIEGVHINGPWKLRRKKTEPQIIFDRRRAEMEFRRCRENLLPDTRNTLAQYGVDTAIYKHDVGTYRYPFPLREFDNEKNVMGVVYLARDETGAPIGVKWRSHARAPKDNKRAPRGVWGERTALLGAHTIPEPATRPAIVITGGEEKALLCHQYGYAAVSPLFGETANDELIERWAPLIVRYWGDRTIVLACDKDRAGVIANLKWRDALLSFGATPLSVLRVDWPQRAPMKFDINDAYRLGGKQQVQLLIDNPVPMESCESDALKVLTADPLSLIDEIPQDLTAEELVTECDLILSHINTCDNKLTQDAALKALAKKPGTPNVATLKRRLREMQNDDRDIAIESVRQRVDRATSSSDDDPNGWWRAEADEQGAIYRATSDGIFLISEKGAKRMSDFVARISTVTKRVKGNDILTVECRRAGQSHITTMDSTQWLNDNKLRDALSACMIAPHLAGRGGVDAIRAIWYAISKTHEPEVISEHLPGINHIDRHGGLCYVTPRVLITASGIDPTPESLRVVDWDSQLSAPTSIADLKIVTEFWWDHYSALFPTSLDAAICCSAAMIGPILPELLSQSSPRVIMAIVGHTGKGKTTVARITQRLWGRTASFPQHATWRAAFQSLVEHRASLGIVDDLRDARDLAEMVSLLFDSGRRDALQRTGQLRETNPFAGAALITAESIDGAGESTANRIAIVPWWTPDASRDKLSAAAHAANALQAADNLDFSRLTSSVIRHALAISSSLHDRLAAIRARATRVNASSRAIDICTRIALCAEIVGEVIDDCGATVIGWPETDDVLSVTMDRQAAAESEATPAAQFLDALEQAIAAQTVLCPVSAFWRSKTGLTVGRPEDAAPSLADHVDRRPRTPTQVPVWVTEAGDGVSEHGCYVFNPREVMRALRVDTPAAVVYDSLRGVDAVVALCPSDNGSSLVRVAYGANERPRQSRVWVLRRPADKEQQ